MDFDIDLNDFEFLDLLGSGSFGKVSHYYFLIYFKVHLVRNLKTNQYYAIKSFEKQLLKETEIKKIYCEAQLLSQLNHPNIVRFYKLYSTPNYLYILMEYIKHGTLYHYFKETCKYQLRVDEVKSLMKSLLTTIAYLHSQNIIHRDIKQENILITDPNDLSQIKLADFGLSSEFETNKFATFHAQCGTLAYMSPEFFDNYNPCTKAVDVYSCGVLLYELTHQGRHPFFKSSAPVQALKSIKQCIIEAKFNEFNCSNEIEMLIRRMAAKEQSERLSAEQALGAFTRNCIPSTIGEMMNGMEKQFKIQQLFHLILFLQ